MDNSKISSKITLTLNPEFAHEIVLGIPYAYYLHQQGRLERVITSKGMKPFYFFCKNVEERFESRTIDNQTAGLNQLPNNWIHNNSSLGLPEDEKHGVLDYSQWTPPPYTKVFTSGGFTKPHVIINNTYNIEFGNVGERPLRSFDIKSLYEMFVYFKEKGYIVIYKRPNNTEFTIDQNELNTLSSGMTLSAEVDGVGVMTDYQLCKHFDNVYTMEEVLQTNEWGGVSYNQVQLSLGSSASGFITCNGGGGILCAYFNKPVIMYVPDGKEKRSGYLTNKNSYINKLSNASIYPIFDNPRETGVSNYDGVLGKMKEIFK